MKRKFTVHPSTITAASSMWPSEDDWYDRDDFEFDLWPKYLDEPEEEINNKYNIYPEPDTQGGMGDMVIYDQSGQDRDQFTVDFDDWESKQMDMAASSSSKEEYKQQYENFIKQLLRREGWI